MPSTLDMQAAVASGLSVVCSTCKRYWEGKERGLRTCTAQDGCGSPLVGDTFHEYDGPITDFLRFCFVCGTKAEKAIRLRDHRRLIGVCSEHVKWVASPVGRDELATGKGVPILSGTRTIVSDRNEVPTETLIPKPQKTLGTMMGEVEAGTFKPDETKTRS
jgi:hypothetical protein